jgi:hypothetical protein
MRGLADSAAALMRLGVQRGDPTAQRELAALLGRRSQPDSALMLLPPPKVSGLSLFPPDDHDGLGGMRAELLYRRGAPFLAQAVDAFNVAARRSPIDQPQLLSLLPPEVESDWPLAWLAREPELGIDKVVRGSLAAVAQWRSSQLDIPFQMGQLRERDDGSFWRETVDSRTSRDDVAQMQFGDWIIRGVERAGSPMLTIQSTPDTLLEWLVVPSHVGKGPPRTEPQVVFARSLITRDSLRAWTATQGDSGERGRLARASLAAALFPSSIQSALPDSGALQLSVDASLAGVSFLIVPGRDGAPLGTRYAMTTVPSPDWNGGPGLFDSSPFDGLQRRADSAATFRKQQRFKPDFWIGAPDSAAARGSTAALVAEQWHVPLHTDTSATASRVDEGIAASTGALLSFPCVLGTANIPTPAGSMLQATPTRRDDGELNGLDVLQRRALVRSTLVVLDRCEAGVSADPIPALIRALIDRGVVNVVVSSTPDAPGRAPIVAGMLDHLAADPDLPSVAESLRRTLAELWRRDPQGLSPGAAALQVWGLSR